MSEICMLFLTFKIVINEVVILKMEQPLMESKENNAKSQLTDKTACFVLNLENHKLIE